MSIDSEEDVLKGYNYYKEDKYEQMLAHYADQLSRYPEDLAVLHNCAMAYNGLGEYDKAIEYLHKLIKL